jgi:hypothetical protein
MEYWAGMAVWIVRAVGDARRDRGGDGGARCAGLLEPKLQGRWQPATAAGN